MRKLLFTRESVLASIKLEIGCTVPVDVLPVDNLSPAKNKFHWLDYVRNYGTAILYTKAFLDMQSYHKSGRVHSSVFHWYSFHVQD